MLEPKFSPEYFYDEVRDGFYIPEMMKRFWAAQMVVLYEIVKICDRHGLSWYADMGTLLGAVRHKGYVPWDDDLDISMNRDDWEVFFKYAQEQLPEGYCALSVRTNDEYDLSIGRVCSSMGINSSREYMEKHCGCPYVVGVDVYPIDRMYKDPEKEHERILRAKAIKKAIDLLHSKGVNDAETRKVLADIERNNHVILHRRGNIIRELILLFEQICMECRDEDYEQVALMNTWLLYDWANCPRRTYEERMEIPFENNVLMGTVNYDELLTIYYHDYMTIKRGGGAHEYPIYRAQEDILRDNLGHNPYRYTFRKEKLVLGRREKTFIEKCNEIQDLMKAAIVQCRKLSAQGDGENLYQMLSGCQEIAISLGNMLEGKFGEGCQPVKFLEEYCELLYMASQQWEEENTDSFYSLLDELEQKLKDVGIAVEGESEGAVREVVFLPCRKDWWDTMSPLYEKMVDDDNINVYVVPLPFYDRDPYGGIGSRHDESAEFEHLKGFMAYEAYDIRKKHPDIIVMQIPFDGCSCSLTAPTECYSYELLKSCDELWYVPCFDPDAPQSDADKAIKSIPVLIEQPAVMNADRVILGSEALREFYVNQLVQMSGEDTRSYWENKCKDLKHVVCDPG